MMRDEGVERAWSVARRPARLGVLVSAVGVAAALGSVAFAGGGSAAAHHWRVYWYGPPFGGMVLPAHVPVSNGQGGIAGTIPRKDVNPVFTGPPGQPFNPAAVPGAFIVMDGQAGFPVTNHHQLVGYWVENQDPNFVTVAQAQAAGAVPADRAPPVGSPG